MKFSISLLSRLKNIYIVFQCCVYPLHIHHRSFLYISVNTKYLKSKVRWKNFKKLVFIIPSFFQLNDTICLKLNFFIPFRLCLVFSTHSLVFRCDKTLFLSRLIYYFLFIDVIQWTPLLKHISTI